MPAFYRSTLSEFLSVAPAEIMGALASAYKHNELQKRQIKAWEYEIVLLKVAASNMVRDFPPAERWSLLLEYPIPRRQKRLDSVLLAEDVIFCIEFKTGDQNHSLQSDRQAEDYALDLRDFHAESRNRKIIPIVVVPKAPSVAGHPNIALPDLVLPVNRANEGDVAGIMLSLYNSLNRSGEKPIDACEWDNSAYHPVPSIIEAAEALFAGHSVGDIDHSLAKGNLAITSGYIMEIIRQAQRDGQKVACFVTGVPGAGKTLCGLKVVHDPELRRDGRPAGVFLSGNGPLVKIISAALARDHKRRTKERDGDRTVPTGIQNVHVFIRDKRPPERVVIFDEAQRAWNAEQNQKKNQDCVTSEPEAMLSIMDGCPGWAVLIALVGGGQEIHDGEAGLAEWGKTLRRRFPHWQVVVSPKALDCDSSVAGQRLFEDGDPGSLKIRTEPSLHLDVGVRSFRAQGLTEWVEAVLGKNPEKASALVSELQDFPMAVTRSLSTARDWLRLKVRGKRRCGLVASSGAIRLRADGIELSTGFRQGNRDMFVHWFLALPPDVRSSDQLEVAASEFECQGLELSWTGLCWGGDLTVDSAVGGWSFRNFSGSNWKTIQKDIDRRYLINSYRVLLTRAREGLIIWVPKGDPIDATRLPEPFNATAEYLQRCGLKMI
jgi:hypothetical protein